MTAPIALFAYNRLDHLRSTIEALRRNPPAGESELIVYSDGPRTAADAEGVERVRAYLATISGFRRVDVRISPSNKGLASSLLDGVTEVVEEAGRAIVLEDDLVTSPHFLTFMNEALLMYERDERVASIHGYIYPVREPLPETFFLRGADCWGWATWKRPWSVLEKDGAKLYHALRSRGLADVFDLGGAYPYTTMLRDQLAGRNQSWAILWHASAFLNGMLTLYPGVSLVRNIGVDRSGTHLGSSHVFDVQLAERPIALSRIAVEEHPAAARAVAEFLRSTRPSMLRRALASAKSMVLRRGEP